MANFVMIITVSVMGMAGVIRAYRTGQYFMSGIGIALLIALHLSIFAGGAPC